MPLHLSSEEFDTGTKYNGTWNLTYTVQGDYRIVYQDFSTEVLPWCFTGCNILEMQDPNNLPDVTSITFPQISDTDSTSVRAWFETAFNTSGWVTVSSSSYDSATNQYTFNFSADVLIRYAAEFSTIAYVFNWVRASPLSGNPTNQLIIDAKYFTNSPKYLHAHSSNITSKFSSTNLDNPAFLVSTKDNFVPNQFIYVKTSTRTLELKLYRPNVPIAPIPILNTFDFILKTI